MRSVFSSRIPINSRNTEYQGCPYSIVSRETDMSVYELLNQTGIHANNFRKNDSSLTIENRYKNISFICQDVSNTKFMLLFPARQTWEDVLNRLS